MLPSASLPFAPYVTLSPSPSPPATTIPSLAPSIDDFWGQFISSVAGALIGALAAGLIAAWIALATFRGERAAAQADRDANRKIQAEDRYVQRRTDAAEAVLLALTPFASTDPSAEDQGEILRELRVRIILYQVVLREADSLSADWLQLERMQGLLLFNRGYEQVRRGTPEQQRNLWWRNEQFEPGREWANDVMTLFAGWLAGAIDDQVLQNRGAMLLEAHPDWAQRRWSDFA